MNILILIPSLDFGGAEKTAQILGNHWHDMGHNVYYLLTDIKRKIVHEVKGEVIYVDIPCLGLNDVSDFIAIYNGAKRVKEVKRKYAIDVSISFMDWSNPINVFSKYKDKVIVGIRTAFSYRDDFKGIQNKKRFIRFVYSKADKIVAVSDFSRNDMIKHYFVNDKKIITIPNAAPKMDDLLDDDGWKYGDNCILSLSRFMPVKQLDRVIRSFSVVASNNSYAKLLLIGDGPTKDYLNMICERLNLRDRIIVSYSDNPVWYLHHAKCFVMASMAEGFPNAMIEAMAFGIPVVTTDSPGGCGEIVGKKNSSKEIQYCEYGILTPYIKGKAPRTIELEPQELLLGRAMQEVLENSELYQKYHKASLERAEFYSFDKIMRLWDKLLGCD